MRIEIKKIKKKLLAFSSAFLVSLISYGQTISNKVINSIGTTYETLNIILDVNIGEPIVGPISSPSTQITQGFLQPSISKMNIKVFLEGYYSGNGLMDNAGTGGCLYKVGASTNLTDADSIRLTLIDKISHVPIETSTSILKTNGAVSFDFHRSIENSYYLKLNHRNSIETWSAAPVYLQPENTYDFSTSSSKAYGNNMIQTFDNIGWAIFSGDISDAATTIVGIQDGVVESQDYGDMESAVPTTMLGYHVQDITGDGVVESADYSLMENDVYYTRAIIRP